MSADPDFKSGIIHILDQRWSNGKISSSSIKACNRMITTTISQIILRINQFIIQEDSTPNIFEKSVESVIPGQLGKIALQEGVLSFRGARTPLLSIEKVEVLVEKQLLVGLEEGMGAFLAQICQYLLEEVLDLAVRFMEEEQDEHPSAPNYISLSHLRWALLSDTEIKRTYPDFFEEPSTPRSSPSRRRSKSGDRTPSPPSRTNKRKEMGRIIEEGIYQYQYA